MSHEFRAKYEATERISLVSSFIASVLIGRYAPIDRSDASGTYYSVQLRSLRHQIGMNLLDIHQKKWSPEILAHSPPGLAERLGEVCASHTVLGKIDGYFQKRYGFAEVLRTPASHILSSLYSIAL